ncbi:hypothetical protein ACQ4PT_004261 [Festuca glaucescens]
MGQEAGGAMTSSGGQMEPDELAVVARGRKRRKNSSSSTSPVPCAKICLHHPLSLSRKMTRLPKASSTIGTAAESPCTAASRGWLGRRRKVHVSVNGCWSICKIKRGPRDKLLPLQRYAWDPRCVHVFLDVLIFCGMPATSSKVLEALDIVRQGADVMPSKQLNSVLDAELGQGWSSKLRNFDFEPLDAASIGQDYPDGHAEETCMPLHQENLSISSVRLQRAGSLMVQILGSFLDVSTEDSDQMDR